jgi:hypothetical protein
MTPLQEGLLGTLIVAAAVWSEPLAITCGYLDADFTARLFDQAPPADTWGTMFAPARGFERYVAYEMMRALATHLGAFYLLGALRDTWAAARTPAKRQILSRGAMNVLFLAACGYRGLMMWRGWYVEAGWPSLSAAMAHVHSALTVGCTATPTSWATFWKSSDGEGCAPLRFIPQTAHDRLYDYDPAFQRLSVVMFAFQWKNLLDSVFFDDGLIFVVHHAVVIVVSLFALHPFSHLYGSFFFGVSEVSTTVLAVVALFDAEHGVEELEWDFPVTRLVIGGLFAVSFLVVRGLLWPYLTYFYCRDGLRILESDPDIHSRFLVKVFMGGLLTLSVMQVIWLGQIVLKLKEELGGMLSKAKAA